MPTISVVRGELGSRLSICPRRNLTSNIPVVGAALRGSGTTKLQSEHAVRIPVMTTMRSGAWRPLDPVDDDQGGA
jgi:hypothetical protein